MKDDVIRVDFNTEPQPGCVSGNMRHVRNRTLSVGDDLVVGDDDWGTAPAEIIDLDAASGTFIARLTGPITSAGDVANTGAHV